MKDLINKIHNADCLEFMKKLPDNSIDLILTSPPYNKNGYRGRKDTSKGKGRWAGSDIAYGDYDDDMEEEDYRKWQIDILDEGFRVLKPNGSFFYNHKIRRSNHIASHPFEWVSKSKFNFYQQITWDRGASPDNNIGYLLPTSELIFWLSKNIPKFQKNKMFQSEVWRINAEHNTEHPAPFPILLAKIIVGMASDKNDIVLDMFMGSGTTALACLELERNFIGIEKEIKYVNMANGRLENYNKQLKLF